jgi:hypothetical protein
MIPPEPIFARLDSALFRDCVGRNPRQAGAVGGLMHRWLILHGGRASPCPAAPRRPGHGRPAEPPRSRIRSRDCRQARARPPASTRTATAAWSWRWPATWSFPSPGTAAAAAMTKLRDDDQARLNHRVRAACTSDPLAKTRRAALVAAEARPLASPWSPTSSTRSSSPSPRGSRPMPTRCRRSWRSTAARMWCAAARPSRSTGRRRRTAGGAALREPRGGARLADVAGIPGHPADPRGTSQSRVYIVDGYAG